MPTAEYHENRHESRFRGAKPRSLSWRPSIRAISHRPCESCTCSARPWADCSATSRIWPGSRPPWPRTWPRTPGITGWAQINGWRGETDTSEKLQRRIEHDLFYIENWSVLLDLQILLTTPFALFKTENAY